MGICSIQFKFSLIRYFFVSPNKGQTWCFYILIFDWISFFHPFFIHSIFFIFFYQCIFVYKGSLLFLDVFKLQTTICGFKKVLLDVRRGEDK